MSPAKRTESVRASRLGPCALAVLLLAACGSRGPVVDTKGVDQAHYKQDLHECQTYSGKLGTGAAGEQGKDQVVKNCLRGRGYSVFD
jgi:outer membrane biogenesis lipoprotein LolB